VGAGTRAARAAGGRRAPARLPPRGLLGLHGHLQGRGPAQRHVGHRERALEGVVMRSVFVTGAYGLLGTWLVRALLEEAAEVTVLRRDHAPRAALTLLGLEDRVNGVAGDVTDAALMDRALGEYEVDTVFHLAAQTIVGTANRSAAGTWDANVRGTWTLLEACLRHGVARTVVAASDKA